MPDLIPDPASLDFYRRTIDQLNRAGVPFLVGGAYALGHYTGIERHTKDFDIFIRRGDYERVMEVLAASGCNTELTFPHWLGKATCGPDFIDVIFSSGNAVAEVDDEWFEHAENGNVLGVPVKLCPPEEMIWSKGFVMERERFDGADIIHIIRACGHRMDWARLLRRFGPNWRVLMAHLVMFGFAYPNERHVIPTWVMLALITRLQEETLDPPHDADRICQGTIISRAQYLIDIEQWGYRDPRRHPEGAMSDDELARWTDAIGKRS
ncbi:MAG TPA: hypothetical protein VIL32_14025 [Steroidobacteraceae bacterium]